MTAVTDINESRLSTVHQFGANKTLNTKGMEAGTAAAKAAQLFENGVIDVVIDCVGLEISMTVGLLLLIRNY